MLSWHHPTLTMVSHGSHPIKRMSADGNERLRLGKTAVAQYHVS